MTRLPLLVSTPHASGWAPADVLHRMLGERALDPEAREALLRRLADQGDPFTDLIFLVPGTAALHAGVSRFVVDLNRHRDEGGPNGVVKGTDFDGVPLYPEGGGPDAGEVEERLRRYWDPFHAAYARALADPDVIGFLDGHSMTARGPALGPDRGRPRPALSLITGGDAEGEPVPGFAPPSVPGEVARAFAARLLEIFGDLAAATPDVPAEVRLNDPFARGGIQERHGDPTWERGKPGLSLEFHRGLYLEPGPDGVDVPIPGRVETLNRGLREAAEAFADLLRPLAQRAGRA